MIFLVFLFLYLGDYCKSEEMSAVSSFLSFFPKDAYLALSETGYSFDQSSSIEFGLPDTSDVMKFTADIDSVGGVDVKVSVEVLKDYSTVFSEVCILHFAFYYSVVTLNSCISKLTLVYLSVIL